jgi:hypothetical protein
MSNHRQHKRGVAVVRGQGYADNHGRCLRVKRHQPESSTSILVLPGSPCRVTTPHQDGEKRVYIGWRMLVLLKYKVSRVC